MTKGRKEMGKFIRTGLPGAGEQRRPQVQSDQDTESVTTEGERRTVIILQAYITFAHKRFNAYG